MVCKKCGRVLENGSLFCNSCGQATTEGANNAQINQQYFPGQYDVQQYNQQHYYPQNGNYQYGSLKSQSKSNDLLIAILVVMGIIGLAVLVFVGDYCGIPMPWDELF